MDAGGQDNSLTRGGPKQLGHDVLPDFSFEPGWRNLNHGSYGAIPRPVQARRQHYLDMYEAKPDHFVKVEMARVLDEARAAVAKVVKAPVSDVVFVGNATEGINTVLRNLKWAEGDTIIRFSTVYDACARAGDFIADYYDDRVGIREIGLDYSRQPSLDDDEIVALFRAEVAALQAKGLRARLCLFDVVSSNPGVLFPWRAMVQACRELGVVSLVDGAQGIGMVELDLEAVNPDFFVTNCHKWLHSPRGSAVLYVPERNQHLLPTTLPTARGYRPKRDHGGGRTQPLPDDGKSAFELNFEWVGTRDDSPYFAVRDAIAWRRDVLGGEERILAYQRDLNRRGIRRVADALGVEPLDNRAGTLTDCAMANVALPIWIGEKGAVKARDHPGHAVLSADEAPLAFNWIMATMFDEFHTFMALYVRWDRFWVRISAQVYLELDDYDFAGRVLVDISERVARGEFRKSVE